MKQLMWLRVHMTKHRLVWRDIQDAAFSVALFFPSVTAMAGKKKTKTVCFTASDKAARLIDNFAKARQKPYTRTFLSNKTIGDDLWEISRKRWDTRQPQRYSGDRYPADWDLLTRPMIALLFKTGIIRPGSYPYPEGQVFAGPSFPEDLKSEPNLYIDYRTVKEDWAKTPKDITDPRSVDTLGYARDFAKQHATARFALLRVWTHSLFQPLMLGTYHNERNHDHLHQLTLASDEIGLENRDWLSFQDGADRSWEWNFVPKDMGGSEWSIQKAVDLRLEPFRRQFNKKAVVKRDMILVMEESEEALQWLTTGVVFAVQTNPWRLEIDFWKSFVNVNLSFLEGLDSAWIS